MINKKLILAVSFGLITSANVHAESIFEAMTEAYNTNPVLQGQRATSGIANEDAALARSGFRPVISANSSYTDSHTHTKPNPTNDGYGKGYNAQVSQSLFSGLQTYNAVRAADQAAKAGIQTLYETEQNVLLNASKAYLDVLRDEAIVKLQKNNEKLLKKQLDETLARFDVGEVTRTDVAQSRASYAQAQSDLISAEGNLEISKANYLHYVGNQPDDLKTPEGLQKFFPVQYAEALQYAKNNNHALKAAQKNARAAKYDVRSKTGALLPEVSFNARTGKNEASNHLGKNINTTDTEYTVNMSVPLYAGGATRAKIRQSKYKKWAAKENLKETERAVEAGVTGSWEAMQTSRSNMKSIQEQVKASAIALEGTQKEEALGNRTVLDVLNAYQALLLSQVTEVEAQHDYYLSGLQLLQVMGKLTAKDMHLNVSYYNPEEHFENTKGKWLTLDIDD